MSMHEFDYRVKFVDMRIGSRQRQPVTAICDHPGCDAPAACRAPWRFGETGNNIGYCRYHAGIYNRAHNFLASMTEKELAAYMEAERRGHKQTWKFGRGPTSKPVRPGQYRHFRRQQPERRRTRSTLQIKCLDALGLPATATKQQIRERYADLVKAYHPDSNAGDRSTETELAGIIMAFKTLKASGVV